MYLMLKNVYPKLGECLSGVIHFIKIENLVLLFTTDFALIHISKELAMHKT
jgi:hypothetical protein